MEDKTAPGSTLLQQVVTFTLPAISPYVAQSTLLEREAHRLIRRHGDGLERYLAEGQIVVAESTPSTDLTVYDLQAYTHDLPLLEELGGEAQAYLDLGLLISLMQCPPPQLGRVLHTNGYGNLMYICLADGSLAAACCHWYGPYPTTIDLSTGRRTSGWWLDVCPLERSLLTAPRLWSQGFRLIGPAR